MSLVEPLEMRRLCSTVVAPTLAPVTGGGPTLLESVRVTPTPKAVATVVLTFTGPVDSVRANDVASYAVTGSVKTRRTALIDGGFGDAIVGVRRVRLASAAYDPVAHTVTLTPVKPFNTHRYLRFVAVNRALAAGTVDRPTDGDDDGIPGGDPTIQFRKLHTGRAIHYLDGNESSVRLRLRGPGRLMLLTRRDGYRDDWGGDPWDANSMRWGEATQLWIMGATADTVLSGTIRPGRRGDATTSLVEIINPGGARIELMDTPGFQVG